MTPAERRYSNRGIGPETGTAVVGRERTGCADVHTGECQVMGEDLGGIAVQIGASIRALAAADEVLVSSTNSQGPVAGSGLRFEARGNHILKGIPGDWHLLAAI